MKRRFNLGFNLKPCPSKMTGAASLRVAGVASERGGSLGVAWISLGIAPGRGGSEIVNSGAGRQPDGAALPSEGGLSRLCQCSGGTPASLLSSRYLSCRATLR